MPTGYTYKIEEGNVSFKDFAMDCARAFGAMSHLRDIGRDTPYTPKKVSEYHPKEVQAAIKKRDTLLNMTADTIQAKCDADFASAMKDWEASEKKRVEILGRYQAMLARVVAWNPPTPDHTGIKQFMIDQINLCLPDFVHPREKPAPVAPGEYFRHAMDSILWDIDYHTKRANEEANRASSDNEWVKKLEESL